MKTFNALLGSFLLLGATSFATPVIWDGVNLSAVVYTTVNGTIHKTVVNDRTYINIIAAGSSLPASTLAVALDEGTGVVAVIKKSDGTNEGTIMSPSSNIGVASNAALTDVYVTSAISFILPGASTSGVAFTQVKTSGTGVRKSESFSYSTGASGVVAKGTGATTGRKFSF